MIGAVTPQLINMPFDFLAFGDIIFFPHCGQGFLFLSNGVMQALQYSSSQQDTLCGSRRTFLHSGHLYSFGTLDMNSQSYPFVGAVAIIAFCRGLIEY